MGRSLVLAITYGILLCVGTLGLLSYYVAAAADYEFDSPAVEARRTIVVGVILLSTLVWLLPVGAAWLVLWRRETRSVPPWLVLLGEVATYGALGYALFAGIWPRLP